MTAAEASFAAVYVIVRSGTVAYVLYLGIGAGTVKPEISGRNITLAAYIWKIRPWFIVAMDWCQIVWEEVTDVGLLGLIYPGVGSRTVKYGVFVRKIFLDTLISRT